MFRMIKPILYLIVTALVTAAAAGTYSILAPQNPNVLPENGIAVDTAPKEMTLTGDRIRIEIPGENKRVVSFQKVSKSNVSDVLGETAENTKTIPVQIYAFEDHNGNGLREPDDQALFLMPIGIYDSPFSGVPMQKINSTESGWASASVAAPYPYQLIVIPEATREYVPTTWPVIVTETNNFATVGFQKMTKDSFRISVFAFTDTDKNGNFNWGDVGEKPLFLAPFKFYVENEAGWELMPQNVSTTDTGWATTSLEVNFPYRVKVEADETQDYKPVNKEIIVTGRSSTLVFPFITK